MATIQVSTSGALKSALSSAASGDTIVLSGGHYALDASGSSKVITIASNGAAVFDSVNLSRMSNLTFDGVDFNGADGVKNAFRVWGSDNITIRNGDMEGVASGFGLGRGLLVQSSSDFTLANMTLHGFNIGLYLDGVDGITLKNNSLVNLSQDGVIGGDIHHAVFSGNSISLDIPSGQLHSDGFQFWNVGSNQPSTDMLIENNVIQAHNSQSHGIYMNNEFASAGGGAGSFFQNVVIKGNTIVTGDGLGLSWAQTNHLDIQGNIILRDPGLPANRESPIVRVHYAATDVSITGNVTHKLPAASEANWQPHVTSAAWTIADNKIVPVGTTLAEARALLHPTDPGPGNGQPDLFRLDALGPTDVIDKLDFTEGDVIELFGYKGGVFHAQKGGNDLVVTVKGAFLDSLDDLRELDAASEGVHIRQGSNDTLVMDIDQPAGVHSIEMLDIAHLYFGVA